MKPLFTPEELAELAAYDAEIDDEPLSAQDYRESVQRDKDAVFAEKGVDERRKLRRIADALHVPIESLLSDQTANDQKDGRMNMDNNSSIAMLGSIANTVMDPEKMKAFEEKRMKDEARNQKIDDLTVHAVETMIHLMDKINERIQDSELTNEQLISLSGAMMTVSTAMGMLRAGMGWGCNGCHV